MNPKSPVTPTVGLVGCGRWGKNLARNFHTLGALAGICEASDALRHSIKDLYPDVQITHSFEELLAEPAIQEIAIATPAATHYTLAKQALEAGKDVYVEKPLCLESSEGQELIQLAKKRNAVLMVGHLLHYHPHLVHLQKMVQEGKLGKLQYIASNRLNLGTIRQEENALWSFAPHDVSVILSLCGHQLPEKVRCTGNAYLSEGVADVTMTTLNFSQGIRAHIYVSWLNPFKEQKLTVVGSKGMVVFDDTLPWDEKLCFFEDHLTWNEGNVPQPNKKSGQALSVPQGEPLKDECAHFLHCCQTRETPKTDGNEGLRVLKVLQAAQESLNKDGEACSPQTMEAMSEEGSSYFAHPTATIDQGALIQDKVKVWHYSHIMSGASIGEDSNIGQNFFIANGVKLGRNCKIQNNVSIYAGVECEEDVFLGPSMVFTNIMNPRSAVPRKDHYVRTHIQQGASIGANATIVCGTTLGAHCFIGAGAVITKNVKPYALMVGNPGKHIGWMSRHGERLDLPTALPTGETQITQCPVTKEKYCLKGEDLECIETELPCPAPELATR